MTDHPGRTTYQVQLANHFEQLPDGRSRGPFNGWYVVRLVDGVGRGGARYFGRDEDAARTWAATMNASLDAENKTDV